MVLLHYLKAGVQAGITRYSEELGRGLEALGEPVHHLPVRPYEFMLGKRRTGGYASIQLQNLARPLRKKELLHSTHFYSGNWRADVVTVHDCFPEVYANELAIAGFERKMFLRRGQHYERKRVQYITPTEAVKQTFMDLHGADDDRVHVTYEGIADKFRPSNTPRPHHLFSDPDAFYVLTVGDLNPRKRLDWLLQAAIDIDDPRLHIVHIGAGIVRRKTWAAQRAREQALEHQLGDRFTRLGHVTEEALIQAYQSADMFALASLDEGFGFPPLEALACATPVAVTDKPVFRETLQDQASYFHDAASMADVIRKAMKKPRRAEAGAAFVRDTYTWQHAARRTLAVYDEVR